MIIVGEKMISLKERLADISSYLQFLTTPEMLPKVKDAVERKDKTSIMKLCRKAKIPEEYRSTVTSVMLSVSPQEKYPLFL